jgi:hypothetical protein
MTILLDCNPHEGSNCEKSILNGEKIKKIEKGRGIYAFCSVFFTL